MKIDLTTSELFESLLEFKKEDYYIDLHNEFTCYKFSYNFVKREFNFQFERSFNSQLSNNIKFCLLSFKDPIIHEINFSWQSNGTQYRLDNFYRGRFEVDSMLFEINSSDMPLFYIDFCDGLCFQIFAKQTILEFR